MTLDNLIKMVYNVNIVTKGFVSFVALKVTPRGNPASLL